MVTARRFDESCLHVLAKCVRRKAVILVILLHKRLLYSRSPPRMDRDQGRLHGAGHLLVLPAARETQYLHPCLAEAVALTGDEHITSRISNAYPCTFLSRKHAGNTLVW